jgi:hypothetical protein
LCIAKLAHTQFRTGVTFGNPEWSCPMDGPPPLPLSVAKGCGQGFGRERTERQLVACAASRPLALGRNQGLRARGGRTSRRLTDRAHPIRTAGVRRTIKSHPRVSPGGRSGVQMIRKLISSANNLATLRIFGVRLSLAYPNLTTDE